MSKVIPNPTIVDVSTLDSTPSNEKKEDDSVYQMIGVILVISNICFVIGGFAHNRPTIKKRLHEACLWKSGHYQKFHCGDIGKSECVPLKNIYPDTDQALDPFQYIIEDNPQCYHDGPIEWELGEVSICICLDGYNVHSGSCLPSLTKWYDTNIICNLVCSIILILGHSTNNSPKIYMLVCAMILIWGIKLGQSLQSEYSRYS